MTVLLELPFLTVLVLALMVLIPIIAYGLSVIDDRRGDGSIAVWGRR